MRHSQKAHVVVAHSLLRQEMTTVLAHDVQLAFGVLQYRHSLIAFETCELIVGDKDCAFANELFRRSNATHCIILTMTKVARKSVIVRYMIHTPLSWNTDPDSQALIIINTIMTAVRARYVRLLIRYTPMTAMMIAHASLINEIASTLSERTASRTRAAPNALPQGQASLG
jgi:hypothetical protein